MAHNGASNRTNATSLNQNGALTFFAAWAASSIGITERTRLVAVAVMISADDPCHQIAATTP
jgi:hypothetical protein